MILALRWGALVHGGQAENAQCRQSHLPVLGISSEHHGVFGFTDLSIFIIFHLFHGLRCLNALILGEGSLMSLSSGMSQEVWPNRFNLSLDGGGDGSNGFEVIFGSPAARQHWKR
jgi:hypothetical protein